MSQSFYIGTAAVLNRDNVDTDQIIPKQFLTRVSRTGYGPFNFFNWRYSEENVCMIDAQAGDYVFQRKVLDPQFELNHLRYEGASILVAGNNFGCGSSREHAVWAILQDGYQAVIAPKKGDIPAFADIFRNNSVKNGLITIELTQPEVDMVIEAVSNNPQVQVEINLAEKYVQIDDDQGMQFFFEMPQSVQQKYMHGKDDIAITLESLSEIVDYEKQRPSWI